MFTLLGLKKYDKKLILNNPNSLFFNSYSDISYTKNDYSYSQIFNSINLPNQLKQLFSDKLHINELEIKEIYKNILDFK